MLARKSFEPDPVSTGVGIGALSKPSDRRAGSSRRLALFSSEHVVEIGSRLKAAQVVSRGAAPSLPASADFIVVGAGVIGLSIGWRLAQAGRSVVVLDRDEIGSGASLAATGMLAAGAEYEPGGEALLPFALWSQRLWPGFVAELEAASGLALDYDCEGTLIVALTRDEVERLRARRDFCLRAGLDARWLSGEETRRLEPALRSSVAAGLYFPHDGQIDPRRLVPALRVAFERAGGHVFERCAVEALDLEGGRAAGVFCELGACRSNVIIVATGAWVVAGGLLPSRVRVPVRPLKGQALALRCASGAAPIRHVVWTEQTHHAPKRDGRLIVGATVEECGFDGSATAGGVFALLEAARRALPSIEDMRIDAIWSGLRPTSEDDAPILGESGIAGLLLAVGHHRNGVLLTPATADAVAGLALGRGICREAQALDLARFGGSS